MPSGDRYWTLLDEVDLTPVEEVDEFLRHVRFGRDQAESTTATYASGLKLYLLWCARTDRIATRRRVGWVRSCSACATLTRTVGALWWLGRGARPVRGPRRVNTVLAGVREFLKHQVFVGAAPAAVLGMLYAVADDRDLPAELRGEASGLRYYAKARHRAAVPDEPVTRASDVELRELLRACRSARDRLIVLLLARVGLRRSEAVGLRRADIHFLIEAKQALDQYTVERAGHPGASDSAFVLVNLFRPPAEEYVQGGPLAPIEFLSCSVSWASRRATERGSAPVWKLAERAGRGAGPGG